MPMSTLALALCLIPANVSAFTLDANSGDIPVENISLTVVPDSEFVRDLKTDIVSLQDVTMDDGENIDDTSLTSTVEIKLRARLAKLEEKKSTVEAKIDSITKQINTIQNKNGKKMKLKVLKFEKNLPRSRIVLRKY